MTGALPPTSRSSRSQCYILGLKRADWVSGVSYVLQINLGSLGFLTTSPRLLQLFGGMLQQCFAGYETSPDFPSSWWVDNDCVFIVGWTVPLTSGGLTGVDSITYLHSGMKVPHLPSPLPPSATTLSTQTAFLTWEKTPNNQADWPHSFICWKSSVKPLCHDVSLSEYRASNCWGSN